MEKMKRPSLLAGTLSAVVLTTGLIMTTSLSASAEGSLDGIGTETNQTQTQTQTTTTNSDNVPVTSDSNSSSDIDTSASDTINTLNEGLGVTKADAEKANAALAPFVRFFNFIFSLALGVTSIFLLGITILDLLYIGVPFTRKFLNPEYGQSQGGGMGGMGMGGMGMGGMGMGGGQPQQSRKLQLISDEAKQATALLTGGQSQGGGMGMGGMGMGGMGMMGGMGGQQEPPKTRSVIIDYFKKRLFFLILFGIVFVLFSTTFFFDTGIKLGNWLLNLFMSGKDAIPG